MTRKLQIRELMVKPTSNFAIQAFRSTLISGIVFIVDAGILWLLSLMGMHYLICNVLSFSIGQTVSYLLSVKFVFKEKPAFGKAGEVTVYMLIAVIGLGLTEVFLWFFTEVVELHFMVSKVIGALLVHFSNFISRKTLLYRSKDGFNT